RHVDLDGQLGEGGGTPELELEAGPGLLEPGQRVAGVDGEADRTAGVGDAPRDGLTDPPRGVGRELEALPPVELLDGVHQAEVALLDQVEEGETRSLVLLGDGDDQPQVRLHERALRLLALSDRAAELTLLAGGDAGPLVQLAPGGVPAFDGLGEANLVILRE